MSKAVRYDSFGPIENLYIADIDLPDPAAGEVQIQTKAAGINPGEAAIREGLMQDMAPSTFPSGQGSDFAGVVTKLGDGVTDVSVGDELVGWNFTRSSQAEFANVPADQVVPKPAELSWEAAGALYVVGATAFAAVRAVDVKPGDTLVVSAAAGGVGGVTVQLAKLRGAEVIGIASEGNHDWLKSKGVTPVAYGDGLADRIRALAPNGVDAFIDTFGPDYVQLALDLGVAKDRIDTIIAFQLAAEVGVKAEGSGLATTQAVLAEIDGLAVRLKRRFPADAAPVQRLRLLNRFFFQELGFAGNVNNYYDPDNSYLHWVLGTRRGIPITLAILYIELATQIDLTARGVSFPGHFLVKLRMASGQQQGEVVIDPFTGHSLSRDELDEMLAPYKRNRGLAGEFDVPLGLFLQAATPREVLARLLRNLKEIHRGSQDWRRLLQVQERLVVLLPQAWEERRDRGLVYADLGLDAVAARDLSDYLAHAPEAPDRAQIGERLAALGGGPLRFH